MQAAQHLHRVMGKPPKKAFDVIVTVDGTWQKRWMHLFLWYIVVVIHGRRRGGSGGFN